MALRCLSCVLFSALVVNILYGSLSAQFVMSLISIPVYENCLLKVYSRFANTLAAAFKPATKPCILASSYPVVPFICPAVYMLGIFALSSVGLSSLEQTQSYSTAYPALTVFALPKAFVNFSSCSCTSSGIDVDNPLT